ncbi:pyridoxamine 5'-phosphate oxidase family protein [Loktanella sp. S4079]|uniref:pyridoxamine 5'-phosphate oxidase family protein n=1 Tax=Loktanella sp. S4079 TaxID=579483 RepID=UPI0005FA12C1|nr:pyridoxamine 5'-phosphate oxidase family protein [Loktanella sp. S4079]KJZ21046.1 pyridoxamine 5'-phosphate oxidase [Loktanella sp. S4079]
MPPYSVLPEHVISSEDSLRALFPATHELAALKVMTALDVYAKEFIARSPFVCIGTQGQNGQADVSPRGDPAGFVRVLDEQTLAIPDRPGNNRLDTLANIVVNPQVGLLFMVPGYDETLRINGHARVVNDPALLEQMQVNGRAPRVAIVVTIAEAFLHCAKAFRRSKLWDPSALQDRKQLPSLAQMLMEQTVGAPSDPDLQARIDADLEAEYKKTMY